MLPGSCAPSRLFPLQIPKKKPRLSSLAALSRFVATSAGFSAPMTALTSKRLSITKSCNHNTLKLKCRSLPTPFLAKIPLAADQSRYKHIKMLSWRSHEKMVMIKIASMVAEAAAYVSDSALESDTTFCDSSVHQRKQLRLTPICVSGDQQPN